MSTDALIEELALEELEAIEGGGFRYPWPDPTFPPPPEPRPDLPPGVI